MSKEDGSDLSLKVHKIFSFPIIRNVVEKGYLKNYVSTLTSLSKKYKFIKFIPIKLIFMIFKKKSDFLFLGTQFRDIICGIKTKNIKIISGIGQINIGKKHNTSFFPIYVFTPILLDLFLNDPLLESKRAKNFIDQTVKWLKKTNIKFLIVSNDSLFIERFLIFCARQIGIKTICIQHGLFSVSTKFLDGNFSDYMFLWGESQRNIFLSTECNNDKIKILGYPHNVVKMIEYRENIKKKICFLGQPFEYYDKNLGERKKKIFEKLFEYLNLKYDDIVYKPHPGENGTTYLPENIQIFKGHLNEAFKNFDIFISLTSASLLDASIANKIAIQILDNKFDVDNYEKKGYCYSIPYENINNITNYIDLIRKPFIVDEGIIQIHEHIATSFLNNIYQIEINS